MVDLPIRRAQLISPFGPGAMMVTKEGVSTICAGTDHWYKDRNGTYDNVDIDHFKIREWRLERMLKVDHLRLPPDFRSKSQSSEGKNLYLNVPFLRFPQWHYCRFCGQLEKFALHVSSNRLACSNCSKKGYKNYLVQVPYVAMCEHGHLQDFPWREWVHRSSTPSCKKSMYLHNTGGTSLASMVVKCDCGVESRSLMGITTVNKDGTTQLSKSLDNSASVFTCQGKMPWLGTERKHPCSNSLRATLRNASNVYFAKVKSAIYIPGDTTKEVNEIMELFYTESFQPYFNILNKLPSAIDEKIENLRELAKIELSSYTDSQIKEAWLRLSTELEVTEDEDFEEESYENQLRIEEYNVLSQESDQHNLVIKSTDIQEFRTKISSYFSDVFLVEKLKETRALLGFTRVLNENGMEAEKLKEMLTLNRNENWLPAYEVYGEGIFLKLKEEKLREWEKQTEVLKRVQPLQKKADELYQDGRMGNRSINPRFVLIHTLAHLLINQLTFDCGYSTAALRERLYVSSDKEEDMCGLLIYTAAGDSDGTMGGLVKMGKPGYLESVIEKALENAKWCSADPVCMEIGSQGGQGPDSSNLAACHNCSLVPETACEEFNRFLDRGLIIGELNKSTIGFFN